MGTTFQPKSIRRGIGQKIEALESELDPNINPLAKKEVSGWAQQNERLKKEKARLKAITPDPINGDERKKLELRNQQLKEAMIKGSEAHNIPAMPSVGQMQDNPDYSTDQHRRWESTWKQWNIDSKTGCLAKAENGYGAVFEWKDGQYRLHADEEDRIPFEPLGRMDRAELDLALAGRHLVLIGLERDMPDQFVRGLETLAEHELFQVVQDLFPAHLPLNLQFVHICRCNVVTYSIEGHGQILAVVVGDPVIARQSLLAQIQ
jgi:hypothetical protein